MNEADQILVDSINKEVVQIVGNTYEAKHSITELNISLKKIRESAVKIISLIDSKAL